MGVAIGHEGPAFALAGDLSVLHDQNGFLPGPTRRPDLVMVVLNPWLSIAALPLVCLLIVPASFAAASTRGASLPSGDGTTMTTRGTPATLAGTAFISTDDG